MTTVNGIDIDATTAGADKLKDAMGQLLPVIKAIYENLSGTFGKEKQAEASAYKKSVSEISDAFKNAAERVAELSKSTATLMSGNNFKGLEQPIDKLIGSMIKLDALVSNAKFFDKFQVSSAASINLVTESVADLKSTMEKFGIPGLGLLKITDALMQNAGQAEKLENNFIALSASAGEMNKIFDQQTGALKDLGAITAAYTNTVANAADATGLSIKTSMEFANSLKEIPDAMDKYVQTGEKGAESTTALVSAMKLMSGTGRSQKEVLDSLSSSYDSLGQANGKVNNSMQKGAEFFATISSVSSGLNLRFKDVEGVMGSVAKQFEFVGNETDGAARTLTRYTDALRETGLTSKASITIIQDMVKNISGLTTGTKAFLSLRSGGPGGLQGAFQIDKMLRDGKLDQVVQMAEKSLKQQFGGRIYTQDEAAGSQQAAAQFQRQRSLLQSGAFGIGKGMDDDKATRLLEALGKGDVGAASKEIKVGQEALTNVNKQGNDIQVKNNNELKNIGRINERTAIAAELQAGATMRGLFAGNTKQQMSNALSVGRQQNDARIKSEEGMPGQDDFVKQLIMMGHSAVTNSLEAGRGIATGAAQGGKDGVDATKDAIDALKVATAEAAEASVKKSPSLSMPISSDDKPSLLSKPSDMYKAAVSGMKPPSSVKSNMTNILGSANGKGASTSTSPTKKIEIEITAPPGFGVSTVRETEDVIMTVNKRNADPTGR